MKNNKNTNSSSPWIVAVILMTASFLLSATETDRPIISIIIDDIGNDMKMGQALVDLPYPITLSFLPRRKYTQTLAQKAQKAGKDIMLHLPMENLAQLPMGHGGLTTDMSKSAFISSINDSLQSLPQAIAVNNHMGSKLTAHRTRMAWVMEAIRNKKLIFVDSVTSSKTVAAWMARQYSIPSMSRDVFLDNKKDENYIDRQFEQLISKAREKGNAMAIAHPHPVTVAYLQKKLPTLDERGIGIAGIKGLLEIKIASRQKNRAKQSNFIKLAQR